MCVSVECGNVTIFLEDFSVYILMLNLFAFNMFT